MDRNQRQIRELAHVAVPLRLQPLSSRLGCGNLFNGGFDVSFRGVEDSQCCIARRDRKLALPGLTVQ